MLNTLCASSQGQGCKCCCSCGLQLRGGAVPPPAAWGAAWWQTTRSEKILQLKVEQGELLVAGAAGGWHTRALPMRVTRLTAHERLDRVRFGGFKFVYPPSFLLCHCPVPPPLPPSLVYRGRNHQSRGLLHPSYDKL